MCLGGGGGGSAPPPPPRRLAVQPALRTPPPPRNIPKPEEIKRETEDRNLITGKKRSKLKVDQLKKGIKAFDAIDPSTNPGAPPQGIPSPKAGP